MKQPAKKKPVPPKPADRKPSPPAQNKKGDSDDIERAVYDGMVDLRAAKSKQG